MTTPEQLQFDANLDLLFTINLEGMDPAATRDWLNTKEEIRTEYREAVEQGATSKYYKNLAESMAKSLPGITNGALSAAAAFQKGDNISGAAAIMDICSSVIPIFASLAGPEGAVVGQFVGAIFSCVGHILAFFEPKQPSLEGKIQKMLDHSQSEEQIRLLAGIGHSINTYATDLKKIAMGVHKFEQNALSGTVALTTNSATVTGTGTTFKTLGFGELLMFDSDTSQKLYEVDEITSDTSLKLRAPYSGASTATSPVKHLVRKIVKRSVKDILEMPLGTEDQVDQFEVAMTSLTKGLNRIQQRTDVAAFNNWTVAGYLEREENQIKEGWTEVLGVWCQIYNDLLNANMVLKCLATPKTIHDQRAKVEPGTGPLAEPTRAKCHDLLVELEGVIEDLGGAWTSDAAEALKVLNKVTSVAKERGLYAHLGYYNNGFVLYVAVRSRSSQNKLNWEYKKNTGWLKKISINVPMKEKGSFVPRYEVLTYEEDPGVIRRHRLDSVDGSLEDSDTVIQPRQDRGEEFLREQVGVMSIMRTTVESVSLHQQHREEFLDVCGIPIGEGHIGTGNTEPVTLVSIACHAHGPNPYSYLNVYTMGKPGASTRINCEPHWSLSNDIRSVIHPPRALPDDPDADAMADAAATPNGVHLLGQKTNITYGGDRKGNINFVFVGHSFGTVPGPDQWSGYSGIEVDPYYLWVFGKSGIACVTHASVAKFIQGKISQPTWIYHDFDKSLWEAGSPPPVFSLSPCIDGTLTACLRNNEIHTADYKIDRESRRIKTSNWIKRGGQGVQVVKMPIPCWSLFESLKATLSAV